MLKRRSTPLLLLLLLLPGCGDRAEPPSSEAVPTSEAAPSESGPEAESVYARIRDHHDRLMAKYDQLAGEMPAEIQHHYEEMQHAWDEALPMHRHMMQGGMMGEHMMDTEDGRVSWSEMHAMDERMRDLHARMAADLRSQGYEDMAAMHEQMTEYYDQALRLSEAEGS